MNNTITIGMDLGDRFHMVVVFDNDGTELKTAKVINTKISISKFFKSYKSASVAMEAGTHSPWISRLLSEMGLTVYVGNPRKLRVIWDSTDKSDTRDARILGMVCRVEPRLLHPLHHRSSKAQADLATIKSRDILVRSRVKLINHIRGLVKATGDRLPKCSAASFAKRCSDDIPKELLPAMAPLFEVITQLNQQIRELEIEIERLSTKMYPETKYLRQVSGVGPITALSYVLHIEDPARFAKSRQVGPFLGLTPRRDQSGAVDKQLPITKAGNKYLRHLLVGCAQYIMGPFGPESNLRLYGFAIAARGGKNAKKRAAIAVARKLAVLLHRLWITGQEYEPFYSIHNKEAA
jgi:transposase